MSVPKRRHINFRRQGNTQKRIQNSELGTHWYELSTHSDRYYHLKNISPFFLNHPVYTIVIQEPASYFISVNSVLGTAGFFYKTSVPIYQTTRRHTLLDIRLRSWHREALTSERKPANNEETIASLHSANTCVSAWLLIEWQPAGRSELFLFGL